MAQQTKKRRLSGTQVTAIKASLAAFSIGITVTGAAILAGADALSAQAAAAPAGVINQTDGAPSQARPQFRVTTPSDQTQPQVTPRQRQQPQVLPPTQTAPVQPQQPQQVTPTQPQQRQQFTAPQSSPRPFTRSRSSR